jgi:hypothetical protein
LISEFELLALAGRPVPMGVSTVLCIGMALFLPAWQRDQVGALGVVLETGVDHRSVQHHRAMICEVICRGVAASR